MIKMILKNFVIIGLFMLFTPALEATEKPNIIIILSDDMGYSDLGCFGGEIDTPNLDSLAMKGLRFTEFYNSARCWPSRANLMTGCYTDKLKKDNVTIPQVLKTLGYKTAMVGKWHLGEDPEGANGPIQRGFDDFYGTMNGAGSYYDPPTLTRNTKSITAEGDDYYYTEKIGEEAVRQIKKFSQSQKPLFQYIAFTAPHWPLHAPEKTIQKYISRYQGGWEQMRQDRSARMLKMSLIDNERFPLPPMEPGVPAWDTLKNKSWHVRNMAVYAAMVDHMDQAVGQIMYGR